MVRRLRQWRQGWVVASEARTPSLLPCVTNRAARLSSGGILPLPSQHPRAGAGSAHNSKMLSGGMERTQKNSQRTPRS